MAGACSIVTVYGSLVTDPCEFDALTRNVNGPAAVGVPLRRPESESVRPGGSDPSATENVGVGEPEAVKLNE